MTWFYNNEGVAQGPVDEPGMMSLISSGKLGRQTLIWHNGLDLWDEAGLLKPNWWQPVEEKSKPAAKVSSDKATAHRSPVPLAPTDAPPKAKSVGLLKRLFGGK